MHGVTIANQLTLRWLPVACDAITGFLTRKQGREKEGLGRVTREFSLVLLAWKMNKKVMGLGIQGVPGSWEKQEMDAPSNTYGKVLTLLTSGF